MNIYISNYAQKVMSDYRVSTNNKKQKKRSRFSAAFLVYISDLCVVLLNYVSHGADNRRVPVDGNLI